jgi:hypothetical protein
MRRVNVIGIDAPHTNYVHGNVNDHQGIVYYIGSDRTSCLLG